MFVGRKKNGEESAFKEIWLISYADMITAMLVVFVALGALTRDQTGIQLANAVGYFVRSQDTLGRSEPLPDSRQPIQFNYVGPRYQVEGDPKAAGEKTPILDAEEDKFQHFLAELKRQLPVEKLPSSSSSAVVDFFEPLNKATPYLKATHAEVLEQVVPLLRRADYRVYVVCWAVMPTPKAWVRATERAKDVADEIALAAQLDGDSRGRLIPLGQPWGYRDYRRPELSFVIAKVEGGPSR